MPADTIMIVNGEPSRLINLSVAGAQVLCPMRLQPDQAARLVLTDGDGEARLRASIAWSSLELAGVGISQPPSVL